MKEKLITFETAKLAKEKGFPQFEYERLGCCNSYDVYPDGKMEFNGVSEAAVESYEAVPQSLLQT